MISVKLLRNAWEDFKTQLAEFPVEAQQNLLNHIEIKVSGGEPKPTLSMIWQWQFCDVIYTAPLKLEINCGNNVRTITGIQGYIYTMDAPQSFDTGEP